ncbi:MAG: ABC transporter permease subunit [Roseburia sp.]
MEEKVAEKVNKMRIPYVCVRILIVAFVLLLFFPDLNPANIIQKAGQAKISSTSSLFTSGVSYSSLVNGLDRAFSKGWLHQEHFTLLYVSCMIILIGVVLAAIGACMSVGNLRMKTVGNRFLLAGGVAQVVGVVGNVVAYNMISSTADPDKIVYEFPVGIPLFAVLAVLVFVCSLVIFIGTPKAARGTKMEMESKYKLFLMLMPFLVLVLAFSYLPLFSWRYAFYDYSAGGEIGPENFVGLKWFKVLLQNPTYVTRLLNVLKNTLALSGLGILTSWVPMFFAIFLSEVKSTRFKRFVQTFTTVPNFISWVLVYAIAFAIFSTDGFINTLINNMGGSASVNYLQSTSHMWLKMLAWGMWKGVGWSAIIYISGIAGIDQQLYEAATVDGAGRFQKIVHVTLPGLLPTYVVMLVMSIAGVLSNGMDQYLVFTNAMNKDMIEVLDLYVYNLGIGSGSIPLSTVVGMAKSIISVILLFVANSISKLIRGNGVV